MHSLCAGTCNRIAKVDMVDHCSVIIMVALALQCRKRKKKSHFCSMKNSFFAALRTCKRVASINRKKKCWVQVHGCCCIVRLFCFQFFAAAAAATLDSEWVNDVYSVAMTSHTIRSSAFMLAAVFIFDSVCAAPEIFHLSFCRRSFSIFFFLLILFFTVLSVVLISRSIFSSIAHFMPSFGEHWASTMYCAMCMS